MLTGEVPFSADSTVGLLDAIRSDDPRPVREINRSIPKNLETIYLKCLEKLPEQRYQDAAALHDDLGRFLNGDPIEARPPRMTERVMRWAKQSPLMAAVCLFCSLFYALHLWMYYFIPPQTSDFSSPPSGLDHHNLHWLLTSLFVGYLFASTFLNRMLKRYPESFWWPCLWVCLTQTIATAVFANDAGPRSAPVPVLTCTALMCLTMFPRIGIVWFTTLCAGTSYLFLAVHANLSQKANQVSMETGIAFIMTLVLEATLAHLLIRRLSVVQKVSSQSRVSLIAPKK